jgi:hypothetical protein
MFSYRIISDGPHRPDSVYLVVNGALFATGQLSFGEQREDSPSQANSAPPEDPLLRQVFEQMRRPPGA